MGAVALRARRRRLDRRRLAAVAWPSLGTGVALAAFEVAPRTGVLPRQSFPPVSEVFAALADQAATAELWGAVGDTLDAWGRAVALATLIAVPFGLAVGSSRAAMLLTRLTVEFLRPIPSVALIPVLILVYGTRPSLKVALATFGATFPLLFQAAYGVADVDPVARDTARAFGLGPLARLRWVVWPSCAPYLATGLRISASVALILVVTGEYVVGVPGLGRQVLMAQSGGAYDRMYALIVVSGLLGLGVNLAFHAVERWALSWHPSQRDRVGGAR